jgi:hypothetical protein
MTITKVTSHTRVHRKDICSDASNIIYAHIINNTYVHIRTIRRELLDTNKLFKSVCHYISIKLESGNNYLESLESRLVDIICSL